MNSLNNTGAIFFAYFKRLFIYLFILQPSHINQLLSHFSPKPLHVVASEVGAQIYKDR